MVKESSVFVLPVMFMIPSVGSRPGFGRKSAPAPLLERFARVRAMILEAVQKRGVPSISIAAADDGRIVREERL